MPSLTPFLLTTIPPTGFLTKLWKSDTGTRFCRTPPTRSHHRRHHHHHLNNRRTPSTRCQAATSSSSWITALDLYELLGVESSSDHSEIKKAYRNLQKQCHPDIAGPAGHHMAIILNEVYSLLSDPNARSAYDQEQAKLSEFRGYTGKPLYSTWLGPQMEQRAVFVDEVKCVGCLKCALHANNTFAIESVYGRARVVAQWADPEDKIIDAIQTCPVDCISMVERSDLAALEFLMSKQPRGNVRMTSGNTGGARVSNIFVDVNKFQTRFYEMNEKTSRKESKESDHQRESKISAVQAIRSISNWWYWKPTTATSMEETSLIMIPKKTTKLNTKRLQEAAARLKSNEIAECSNKESMSYKRNAEYWTPMLTLPSPASHPNTMTTSSEPPKAVLDDREAAREAITDKGKRNPLSLTSLSGPFVMSVASAAIIATKGGEMTRGGLNEHIGGTKVLEAINSLELQVILAGITWFIIGLAIVGVFDVLGSRMFRR